jgi:KaiC/GvpD/RAD55 family RecA-like ATPase
MEKTRITALLLVLPIILAAVTTMIPQAHAISYSVSATSSLISATETTSIRVAVTGGASSTSYTFRITITKPSSAGQSTASTTFTTTPSGLGSGNIVYPSASFTATTGTVNTDVSGTYTITVDETSPVAISGVAATTFTVCFCLTISITSPASGTRIARNSLANVTALVRYVDQKPDVTALVAVNTPAGALSLTQTIPGTYTGTYKVQLTDSTGSWTVKVNATDGSNVGTSSLSISVVPAQITVYDLVTRNDVGSPTSVFYTGDTLYASFRLGYSGGGFLANGTYRIQIRSPTGANIATIDSAYDPNAGVFSTPTGHAISSSDPDGVWQLYFPTSSLNDTYGNSGPTAAVQYKFTVHTADPFLIQTQYLIIASFAIASGVTGSLVFRKFNTTDAPFEQLFKLTGGELQPPMTLMILEDPSTGANTLALQLINRELAAGRSCGIISYTNFPTAIAGKMREMGWNPAKYVEENKLSILDCYSALAGIDGASIKDPSDLTEVSIQINSMIEKFTPPFTLFLDSVTPIFNGAEAKSAMRFLNVLVAKAKSKGGTFILTATKGSLQEDVKAQLEGIMDGVIDLSLVKKGKQFTRSLMVKKISERQIFSNETDFKIIPGQGIILKKPRINFERF